jgi:hypothetical protein
MVAVIVIKIWRSFPFMMLSLLAALQVIDKTVQMLTRRRSPRRRLLSGAACS